MKIDYRKSFLKELSKIPSGARSGMEDFVFEELPKANSIFGIGIVEQMKGYRSYYKIRFGSYRIGLKMENDTVILEPVTVRCESNKSFHRTAKACAVWKIMAFANFCCLFRLLRD